jgi:hypothetical protein
LEAAASLARMMAPAPSEIPEALPEVEGQNDEVDDENNCHKNVVHVKPKRS